MKLTDLYENYLIELPVDYKKEESFRFLVKSRLERYAEILSSIEDLPNLDIDIIEKNKIISTGILRAIDAYYEGLPSKAYNILTRFMKESELRNFLNKDLIIPPASNFFRIRVHDENYPLKREELFHVPFELRGKVNTQRFSVHGLPSLCIRPMKYIFE